ncbi:MAG: GumC family protein [Kiritimatiellia bacterium]
MPQPPYIAGDAESSTGALSKFPDWREGVAILMERAWLGGLVAAAVFLLFFFHARRQIPYYRSTATLLVEAQIPKILNYQDILAYNTRNLEYFNTHINALHSRKMMAQALERSGLAKNPRFLPGKTPEEQAETARGFVTVTAVEKSRMINLVVEHPDPQIASDLANALAQAYIQQDLDNRMGASMQAIDWLRERSDEYREKLEKGLSELQEYREKTQSVSLEEDQNIVIEKLKALNSALTVAQTERIQAETAWRSLQAQIDGGVSMSQIAAVLNDASVQAAFQKLQDQQRELAGLQQRYRAQHPDLQQAVELEQKLQKQFTDACGAAFHAMKSRFEMLEEREKNLQAALEDQEKAAFELDRKLVRYNELKRNIEADQEIHQAVIARMKEASISESLPTDVIRLAEEARPAQAPFRPRPGQAMARGTAFGLILGLAAIFLFYYADHRFRRNEEVERLLGIPVLATVPLIGDRTVQARGLVSHLKQTGEVAESFRTLRASLLLKEEIRNARVLMITSAGPGEGKSLISTNLAISLAQDGRRTLLVGADLRRPVLSKIFDSDPDAAGLAEVLKGKISWPEALLRQGVANLDVLCSGHIPSHPSELLGRQALAEFLRAARDRYQHVIVDAPPVLGVSDSLVLLPNADGVLFVVRYGVTHSLGASHAILKLQGSGTPCLGGIMNGVNLKSVANYYYYRRYGGYAYRHYVAQPGAAAPSSEG